MENINFLITGVGGQGTVLASDILTAVGFEAGYDVKKSDLLGLSVRGGAVIGHVRWGEKVYSPIIPEGQADYLIAFEKLESLRYIDQVKPTGTAIINQQKIIPVTVSSANGVYPSDEDFEKVFKSIAGKVLEIPAIDIALQIGSSKVVNIVLLGCLSKHFSIDPGIWEKVLNERVPKKFIELNINAFHAGRNYL